MAFVASPASSAPRAGWAVAAAVAQRTFTGHVLHADGRTRIPVRLLLPDGTTPPPWPLVIYSPGLGGSLDSGALWTEVWRAAGWVCLHVLHPPTSDSLFQADSATLTQQRIQKSLAADHVPARAADISRVLDHLLAPGTEFSRYVDAMHIAAAGHSYGALTVMALAGRALQPTLREARITAAIALSPGVGSLAKARSMSSVAIPMMCVTGALDEFVDIGLAPARVRAGVPLAQRMAVYTQLPPGAKRLLFVHGADHMTFAGQAELGVGYARAAAWQSGGEDARIGLVRKATTQFLVDCRERRFPHPGKPRRVEMESGYQVDE